MSRRKSNSDSRKAFTANFRMLLSAASWTQTEAAQQLGISQGSVSDFSSGKRVPSTKGIESIAYRFGGARRGFHVEGHPDRSKCANCSAATVSSRIAESSTPYRPASPTSPGSAN